MIAYVFTTQADAQALSDAVDRALNYPNLETGTQRYADIVAHPDGTRWAYPSTDTVTGIVTSQALQEPTPEELDDSWFPIVDPHAGGGE